MGLDGIEGDRSGWGWGGIGRDGDGPDGQNSLDGDRHEWTGLP